MQEAESLAAKFATTTVNLEKCAALQSMFMFNVIIFALEVSFWCPSLLDEEFTGSYAEVDEAIEKTLVDEALRDAASAYTLLLIRSIEASQLPPGVDPADESAPSVQTIREKRRQNFMTIIRNLVEHPEKENFRRLRMSNKLISDLLGVKHADKFFEVRFAYCLSSTVIPHT